MDFGFNMSTFAWNLCILKKPHGVLHISLDIHSFPKVWRLRVYKAEKAVGAAKPILFLVNKLVLESGQCQRVL